MLPDFQSCVFLEDVDVRQSTRFYVQGTIFETGSLLLKQCPANLVYDYFDLSLSRGFHAVQQCHVPFPVDCSSMLAAVKLLSILDIVYN